MAISKIDTGQTEQGLAQLEQLFAGDTGATVAGPTLVLAGLRAGQLDKAARLPPPWSSGMPTTRCI